MALSTSIFLACGDRDVGQYSFHRAVVNLEYTAIVMRPPTDPSWRSLAGPEGELWIGQIMRRTPGETSIITEHYVPFMARYVDGVAVEAWCDVDLDGLLTDQAPLTLSVYRSPPGSRSFLADFRWTVHTSSDEWPIDWTVRVVLEPSLGVGRGPVYRVQMVYGMVGSVEIEDRPRRAVLFDGNGDGLYTTDFLDGVFIDLDGDRRLDIDPMSEEFGPFAAPFSMGRYVYQAVAIDPAGRHVTLRRLAEAEHVPPPVVGEMAPDLPFDDIGGHRIRLDDYRGHPVLIYFFATWCGQATDQASELKELYARYRRQGLEILMISFDSDRAALDAFRSEHGFTWPTMFTGRALWEHPWGRAYKVRAPGIYFLIDDSGKLQGQYEETAAVEGALKSLVAPRGLALSNSSTRPSGGAGRARNPVRHAGAGPR